MQKSLLNRTKSQSFSKFSNEFLYNNSVFTDFIQAEFSISNIGKQIELKKSFDTNKRAILSERLKQQYQSLLVNKEVQKNIDSLLDEKTFTVTTGHQLNLFTGPIYFLYKIIHTIKLAERLKLEFPTNHFVPIYWMASEDHDFEEINHTYLYNKKIEFKSDQIGPVGSFELENWSEIQASVDAFFTNHPESKIHDLIQSYSGKDLAEATFKLVHELFKNYGLVILDANNADLKTEFVPVLLKEVEESFSEKCVLATNEKLEKLGYKPQIYARPINLFYCAKGFRERIIFENETYSTEHLGTKSLDELKKLIQEKPENFSPNVVLRPVYQETILPNLVYIGGGAEIAYWTQLKAVFDTLQLPFPLLQVRNSVQIFDKNAQKKLAKLNLSKEDIFELIQELKNNFVKANLTQEIDFTALEEKAMQLQGELNHVITSFDVNLKNFAEAENVKIIKQLEGIKSKIQKIQKSQFDAELKMLEDLKTKLFPNGGLQERVDNFLNFCPDGDYVSFISLLHEAIDPLEKDLILLEL